MKKYFLLQLKRVLRFLPWGLTVVLVLFGCMSLLYNAMVVAQESDKAADTAKIAVGVVGTAGDQYLQWGLAAMQFDSTAMSIQLSPMEEAAAIENMKSGKIAAYIVFPEAFVGEALSGNVQQIRFVSTAGASGLVSILKEEITTIVGKILVACESGSYGVGDALTDTGNDHLWGKHVNDLALDYVDFLFVRSKMYRVESLAVPNAVPFDRYMLAGLTVLLLMLSCLPFAPLYIQADRSLSRVLRSKRIGAVKQTLAEFGGYGGGLCLLLGAVTLVLRFSGLLPEGASGWQLFAGALPSLFVMAALSYLMYALSAHLISGVLLAFFTTLALCFLGGCMYPVQIFPDSIQRLAAVLPTGLARQSLTDCFMGMQAGHVWLLLGYGSIFLALATVIRGYQAGKVHG